jgi:maleate isomerase
LILQRVFLGMLTPSSNTVLEPVTTRMLAGLPEVTAHFGRFRVTEISLSDAALGQFDIERQLAAAELLADARVSAIVWNGTSAGWMGLDQDRRMCEAIAARTGVRAGSSVLALAEIFRRTGVRRYGLVTPYIADIQNGIVKNFAQEGFECAAERHLGEKVNFAFSEFTAEQIAGMVREVAKSKPDAITMLCTNLCGAPLVEALEHELGIPIYDSISTAVWSGLRIAGIDARRVVGWGRLFREVQ